MSKINAVRFINLNYNNNAMKINDECMQFSGKSTLLSLRNGGGKTVLVQMMTAPFVHRGKQKTKDRPFESYFTTAKPSFILVEWLLDAGAGYVLTGLMVRKNQEISEEKTDALEMMAIISEYKEPCMQDIHHLPVVEQNEKTMKLKSYNSCRKLFEDYKKDKKISFFCYDMSSPAQSRQYFYKLMEYQINYKEWETIIRKVNVKESGLSELFSDCRTEKELVEKWFLEAVESKLNKEENKVKNFQEILEKYAGKYKNIKEQLKRRDAIQKFKEAAEEIQINAEDFLVKEGEKAEQEKVIAAFIARLNVLYEEAEIERERQEEGRKKLQEELEFLKYEQLSCEFHEKNREKRNHASNREMIDLEKESLLRKQQKIQKKVHVFLCAKQQEMVNEDKQEWEIRKEKAAISRTKEENLEPERNRIGGQLSGYYEYRLSDNKEKQEAIKKQKLQIRKDISQQKDILNEYREKTKKITESKGSFRSLVRGYDNIEIKYNSNYRENLSRNILGVYEAGMLDIKQEMYDKEQKKSIQENKEQKEKFENTTEEIHRTERAIEEKREKYFQKDSDIKQAEKEKKGYEQELEERKDILKYLELPEEKLFAREEILHKAKIKMQELSSRRRTLEKKEDALQKEYKLLVSGRVMELPDNLKEEFEKLDVPVVYGMEWLKKNGFTEKKNKEIVSQNPFLPYALILTRQELKKLAERNGETYTSFPVPIIERENLESIKLDRTQSFVKMQDIHFYILFNENLLDEEKMEIMIEQKQKDIADIRETMQICKNEYEDYFHRFDVIKRQAVTKENWDKIQKKLQKLEKEKEDIFQNIQQARDTKQSLKKNFEILQKTLRELEKKIESQAARQRAFKELRTAYAEYEENNKKLQEYEREEERLENRQHLTEEKISQKDLESAKNQTKYQLSELERKIAFSEKAIQKYRENLTALSEYNNFSADEEIHFEQDFKKMSEKELRDFKGMLIRDYNDIIRCVQKCRETLAQTLNKIARQEAFQDASYKTPLENMLKVCDNAAKVLRQLNITLESYDSLMKQLEVDISLVETEKKNVTELLEDYVQNIHKNLEKIGRNSTIKIREKSIKMLKVILPVWEDNEKLYSLRLSDLVDEITEEGIRLFENNENAQEYIGRKVTSKNLYDTVVGTGNVQIQLYKIEEQREQQISWNQVAKNSGGEGFLSAFVILSSLLDYMRKDDSDIFMDKNEGKVLLMDNPFAQTNAEHLLKPLMNLADKTNTQLICLTGLGGESIYNRFDNIYVLNLIEAHLRNGIQYLRPEHKKGEEVKVETILPTHIEVEEMLF